MERLVSKVSMLDRFRVGIGMVHTSRNMELTKPPVTEAKSYIVTSPLEHLCRECSNPAAALL
jgi:hypothetical protein